MDIGMRSLHPAAADHSVSIRGSRCTALIILSLRSRAVVLHYCSSCRCEWEAWASAGVTAQQRWSRSHGRKTSREDSHTRSVRWPAPLRASALKKYISLKEYMGDRVFLKMSYHPCVSGCCRSLAPQDGHDHCLTCLGIQHAEEAFVDGSCSSCGDMTISELRNRLRCVKHGGVPLPLPRSGVRPGNTERHSIRWSQRWFEDYGEGFPKWSCTPEALRSRRGYCWFGLGPLLSGVPHPFPSALPLMNWCRSLHRRASPLSPGMTTRLRCPLWVW